MKRYINLVVWALITLFFSCAEDKGNYDYHSINEVVIKGIPEDTAVAQMEVLRIRPELERLLENTEEGLEYSWTVAGKEIATTRDLDYEIPTSWDVKKYDCIFHVTDTKNGMKYFQNFSLNVVASFSWGYYFLCEESDGTSVLSYFSTKEGTTECLHAKSVGAYSLGKRPIAIAESFGNISTLGGYYYTMYIVNGENENQVIITDNGAFMPSGLITNGSLLFSEDDFMPEYALVMRNGTICFVSNGKFYTYSSGWVYRPGRHDKEYYWSHPASDYSYVYAFDELSKKFYILKNQINDPKLGLVQDAYAWDRVVEIEDQPSYEGHSIITQSVVIPENGTAHTMYMLTEKEKEIHFMTFEYINSQAETEELPALNEYGHWVATKSFTIPEANGSAKGVFADKNWYVAVGNKVYASPILLPQLEEFVTLPDGIGKPASVALSSKETHLIVATYDENSSAEYKGSFVLINLATGEQTVHRNVMKKCIVAKGYDANPWF